MYKLLLYLKFKAGVDHMGMEYIKLATEIVGLTTALIIGLVKLASLKKEISGNFQQVEERFNDIHQAIRDKFKFPLEGKWGFALNYDEFKGGAFGKNCKMIGNAIITWDHQSKCYEIILYCTLFTDSDVSVTNVLHGTFGSNLSGTEVPTELKVKYVHRTASIAALQSKPKIGYEFAYTGLHVTEKSGGQVKTIVGTYVSPWSQETRGTIHLSRP